MATNREIARVDADKDKAPYWRIGHVQVQVQWPITHENNQASGLTVSKLQF
jgi:hypothetical protein